MTNFLGLFLVSYAFVLCLVGVVGKGTTMPVGADGAVAPPPAAEGGPTSLRGGGTIERRDVVNAAEHFVPDSPYVILCDAGSTGTRLYVYRTAAGSDDVDIQVGPKVQPGLSTRTPDDVASYLKASLDAAKTMIPIEFHHSTPLFVYATAGMRLVPENDARSLYDALATTLKNDPDVPFVVERKNLKTIPGDDEGYFAALAVNYLAGRLGSDLVPRDRGGTSAALLGALDLGGASAQVVFPVTDGLGRGRLLRALAANGGQVGRNDFFSASLLGFGGEQIRERVDAHVVALQAEEERANKQLRKRKLAGATDGTVSNPCLFPGYKATVDGVRHIGTGDADLCLRRLEEVMDGIPASGVAIPPVKGHFYAMTLYYFVIDFARVVLRTRGDAEPVLRQLSVPNPSVDALRDAAATVCGWDHEYLLRPDVSEAYAWSTFPEQLPNRCLEFTYLPALLKRLGFPEDSTDVEFVGKIQDESVEWTLGAFLHLSNAGDDGDIGASQPRLLLRADPGSLYLIILGVGIVSAYVARRYISGKLFFLTKTT